MPDTPPNHCETAADRVQNWFSKEMKIDEGHCNVNQKHPHLLESQSSLSSGRVAWRTLKEYFLVSRKLKSLQEQSSSGPKFHHVVPIKSAARQDSGDPWLQELEHGREERHFHLGRVIKYFTI